MQEGSIGQSLHRESAEDLSTQAGNQTSHRIWSFTQRGLVYPSPYAVFATFFRNPPGVGAPVSIQTLRRLLVDMREEIHISWGNSHTTAVMGVGFELWREMCAAEGKAPPAGMKLVFPAQEEDGSTSESRSALFTRRGSSFVDSEADLWFHIKSDVSENCTKVFEYLKRRLEEIDRCVDPTRTVHQSAATKSNSPDKMGGKVIGCRFSENLNNPTDPVSIQENTIVGFEDPDHIGASYVLAQRFYLNWDQLLDMSPQHIEDLVGRTTEDALVPSRDDHSHIKCARAQNQHGNTMQVLRLGLPFGQSAAVNSENLRAKGASVRDEAGIYFAGYAKNVGVLETIMNQQIGAREGFMADRLLAHARSDLGGFYYIPSLTDLGLAPTNLSPLETTNWKRFPGVDWSRLDRHFREASENGYMHYNHKEYLFRMATMSGKDRERYLPPSNRVLKLLANAFSRWQDGWYFDRAQQELGHLSAYIEKKHGRAEADRVMALPVAERMAWAFKVALGDVFTSHEYGFRGRRRDEHGDWINGADTYRIQPAELIVGALPNLGLGQGKYLIDYARDDERTQNFFAGLGYASGVGHVVPAFGKALEKGIGNLQKELASLRDAATDASKRSFYNASILALEGVAEYSLAYARLAAEMAAQLGAGQSAERKNLLVIEQRMKKLAVAAPETFLEAAQLVFTLHACMHLTGEPTAIGRLDQLLAPFYARDVAAGRLTDEQAQEIIDCFWIKIGEKVQINRQFVEDHQVYGNLAMGGSAGNYPKGSSNNQWIQQVTVGGTVADDAPGEGTGAYNAVTLLCIRAARRLPLNAPCLSLRVRKDIPDEILHEASLAILSGGAHPILLSDEKIIPGLAQCGNRIGEGDPEKPTAATPVREKSSGLFDSKVELSHARDYACDGCYEPQLSGRSWFTLGGLTLPQVLEMALNQGMTWASAGPVWFRGQRQSFTSKAVKGIRSFEELCELFFEHMRFSYAKQVDGTIGVYGQLSAYCPSPLLSVFVEGCVEKGLDFYAGGPRYNMIAPCLTGLSTTIDSLWAIRAMVFDSNTAVTSLPELVEALLCDWGESMVEPFVGTLAGPARIEARAERFKRLREVAMAMPKYGRGSAAIDAFGNAFVQRVAETIVSIFTNPAEPTAQKMVDLAKRMGTPQHPFGGFQITPGVGTFENYLDWGAMTGASADGRHRGDPLASDLSPSPSYADAPVDPRAQPFSKVLAGFSGSGAEAMWDGAPTDFNIPENFPGEALQRVLRAFADGQGSNIMTITCADAETFAGARKDPEKYDLLRVRMGGWSEFFVAMFPAHQEQHQRRPVNTPDRKG
ncbi:Dyp-type peroxidase [Polyangium sp. 15x6]|uniref:Dyp-type peroxidase n=1 Tax=Polyangium sp. 15x6 TaxID=3042687 RepID=UPI00249AD6BF|nr:Dyp-type peroxidase [Polyangium sp. 15x6]MDI3288747.1 Dyp-type peroxidase [Polyangium sp. 15x6]